MKILVVKLSSLGDVVHTMPAVQDMRAAFPAAKINWVVEKAFAPLVERCDGLNRVVPCELRKWRAAPLAAATRAEWSAFKQDLQSDGYDAVIDLQGLTKSALVSRMARLRPGGKRYALGNRTDGSSYEAPSRWVANVAIEVAPTVHAVDRSREVCGRALGYAPGKRERSGLVAAIPKVPDRTRPAIALVHGSSRADKEWPVEHWLELGRRLEARGFAIALPQGNDQEKLRSQELARGLARATVWPEQDLAALVDAMAACAGAIGVDSGPSHVAVALGLPHVQIYNFDTAWRTGPRAPHQRSVFAQPTPTIDAVWDSWIDAVAATGPLAAVHRVSA